MLESAIVHTYNVRICLNSRMMDLGLFIERLYYCNNLGEVSEEKGTWGGVMEIPEPMELYHKIIMMIIIIKH